MADNTVHITSVEEGAFEDALGSLPPWATQQTAEDIQRSLNKLVKIQSDALATAIKCCAGGKGMNKEDVKKVNDELSKIAKNLKDVNADDAKRRKRNAQDEKEWKEKKLRDRDERNGAITWGKTLTALTLAGKAVAGAQLQYYKTSKDLYNAGINLVAGNETTASSMMSLNQMVTLTGLRLETLQKVAEKYSSSINAIGMSKFAKTVSTANTRLVALGYSSEEQAELIATMIESESNHSDMRRKTALEMADDAAKLGKNMANLSMLTGLSSAKLQENIKAMSETTDSAVVSAMFGEKAAKRVDEFASTLPSDTGLLFQKFAASMAPEATQAYRDMATAGQGHIADAFIRIAKDVREGTKTTEQAREETMRISKSLTASQLQHIALLAEQGNAGAQKTLNSVVALNRADNKTSLATPEEREAAIKAKASIAAMDTAMERTKSLTQTAFPLLETQVDAASASLKVFNDTVLSVTDSINPAARSWIGILLQAVGVIASVVLSGKLLTMAFGTARTATVAWALATRGASAAMMLLSKAPGVIMTSFRAASSLVGPAFGLVANAAGYLGSVLQSVVGLIPNAFRLVSSAATKIGGRLLSLMNPVTKVIAAFTAGYAIGTAIYEMVSDFEWFTSITDSIFGGLESVVSAITGIPGQISKAWDNIASAFSDVAGSVSGWFSGVFGKIGGFFGQFGNMITGMFPWVSKVAEYGKGVGEVIGDLYKLWSGKVEWIGTLFNGIKGKVADWFSWVPGIGNASNSSPVMAKSAARTEISVTKSPAPSTIDSPSAVPASKRTSADSVASGTNNIVMMDNTGNVKPPVANDINTLLGYQSTIMAQLLDATQTIVGVNRDILKYTKANS